MKKLGIALGLAATSAFAATPQQFYRADKATNLVEGGWQMNTTTSQLEGAGQKEEKAGSNSFDVSLSRGINDDIAVGLNLGNSDDGFKDIGLFVEGQKHNFFYGATLNISADKETDENGDDENGKSGGMNYNITLGYSFLENAGIRLDYAPGFTSATKDSDGDSTETDVGATSWVQLFYEHTMGKSILGGAVGSYSASPNSDNTDLDQTFTTIELYYVHQFNSSFDLTAGARHWIGDSKSFKTLTNQGVDVGVRYRF